MKLSVALATALLTACAGSNPNPGERTTDSLWERGKFIEAFDTAWVAAQRGEPWAQLRIGMYYDIGTGVEANLPEAIKWYSLAARQFEEGGWAEGRTIAAVGKSGFFGQKNDALIAQYRLADLYFKGEGIDKNLALSWLIINNVIEKSNGKKVYFCCDWSGGRTFSYSQFIDLKSQIETELNKPQLIKLNKLSKRWVLKYDL